MLKRDAILSTHLVVSPFRSTNRLHSSFPLSYQVFRQESSSLRTNSGSEFDWLVKSGAAILQNIEMQGGGTTRREAEQIRKGLRAMRSFVFLDTNQSLVLLQAVSCCRFCW